MQIENIKKFFNQEESDTLEFKTSLSQLKPAFETVCAFLNAKGGAVSIGVNNNSQLIGQSVNDKTQQEIS